MVDVTATAYRAVGHGFRFRARCPPAVIAALRDEDLPKGDALAVAPVAGIQGGQEMRRALPLAHDRRARCRVSFQETGDEG